MPKQKERKYLAFNIGCIECGEDSGVIGIFDTEEQAVEAIKNYLDDNTTWGRKEWSGQHHCEVFEITL